MVTARSATSASPDEIVGPRPFRCARRRHSDIVSARVFCSVTRTASCPLPAKRVASQRTS